MNLIIALAALIVLVILFEYLIDPPEKLRRVVRILAGLFVFICLTRMLARGLG